MKADIGDNILAATSENVAAHGYHQKISVMRMALA
jgi:hypothetical protein